RRRQTFDDVLDLAPQDLGVEIGFALERVVRAAFRQSDVFEDLIVGRAFVAVLGEGLRRDLDDLVLAFRREPLESRARHGAGAPRVAEPAPTRDDATVAIGRWPCPHGRAGAGGPRLRARACGAGG